MLPARHRLRERADFTSAVRGSGAVRAGGRLIVVHANRADARADSPPRVGFVVSKAVGNAVVRNRTKRRLRAATASRLTGIPHGVDVVVRANPASAQAGWDELEASLATQLESAVRKLEQRTRAAGPATSRTTSLDGRAATGPAG
ncbi:ribonuclease P protein component [Terracoccus luteus]|uniref:ribonuclease P protein component n=1 Tax=Terracoccus luteus TaxID=53356 RepID=UPI000EAF0694|nr:ribonuclease P protein component [Terracoccus luteus]